MRTLKIKTLLNGTPINEEEFFKWLDALGSGNYPQARYYLQNPDGFCCLGVACEILIPKKHKHLVETISKSCLFGETPYQQPHSPEWLKMISGDVGLRTTSEKFRQGLMEANDNGEATFLEIKQELENTYVHGISR